VVNDPYCETIPLTAPAANFDLTEFLLGLLWPSSLAQMRLVPWTNQSMDSPEPESESILYLVNSKFDRALWHHLHNVDTVSWTWISNGSTI
jgi:hypothetical protein